MHIATVENLPAQSNRAVSNSWRIAQGVIWGGLAVVVVSGWFVVARLGLRQDIRVWDVMALRFGEGAHFLTSVLLVGLLCLRVQAWPSGITPLFAFNRAVVLLGPRAAAVIFALMPVTATLLAIPVLGERPSAAAICIIALGVGLAATSSNQDNKKGESQ
jgi:drug/metabolite transporter (DMT)-like permease